MASFFGSKYKSTGSAASENERVSRHSSGWGQLLGRMRGEEPLRVLDMGPTSSTNINFVTELGHSIYLANLVEDAARGEWMVANEDGEGTHFNVERFLKTHLDFSGRDFDVVLFWDTLDYLPVELVAPTLERIHAVMAPGGELLAMFHPPSGPGTPDRVKAGFHRYHLTNDSAVDVQRAGEYPIQATYSNRQIERLFESYQSFHFFLGKDNMREIVVVR
jgi:hypothetical protein